jgi:protease I
MDLTGCRVLILAGPDFEDRELFYPLLRFREAGATVQVAGLGQPQYKGKAGLLIDVDGPCEAFVGQRWDAVVVPGGWAPDKIRMNAAALQLVQDTMARSEGLVAAICHGGWVLASAGVLQGRRVTSYKAIQDDMTHAGAAWIDAEVVVDGDPARRQGGVLVTSRTPDDLPAFCRAIVQQLGLVTPGRACVAG